MRFNEKITSLLLATVLFISAISPINTLNAAGSSRQQMPPRSSNMMSVSPDQAIKGTDAQTDGLAFEWITNDGYDVHYYSPNDDNESYVAYECYHEKDSPVKLSISSSNTDVLKIISDKTVTLKPYSSYLFEKIEYKVVGIGYADVIISTGTTSYKQRVYSLPWSVDYSKPKQTDYNKITIKWKKVPGCSGYYVESTVGNSKRTTVKTVGPNVTSVTLPAKWNVECCYEVRTYIKDDVRTVASLTGAPARFTAKKMPGATISSVTKSGSSNLQIKWNAYKGAKRYKLYRSTRENGTYKCIYTTKDGKTTSYKQKVSKNIAYYYKLITVNDIGDSGFSPSVSQIIPTKKKAKRIPCKKMKNRVFPSGGQYVGYHSSPDKIYYYQSGGKLHAVFVQENGNLKIYTLNSSFKVQKTKTVKLKYDVWGGFYQGIDGNFYVAVGYENPKESNKKIVIKVIQYNSKWKKLKTANINGGGKSLGMGIYSPFDAGNCRMDMQGNTLYLFTSRKMFMFYDGFRHQSNIAFKINTKTMKAKDAEESYASHSFNQFVKFKDGTLYLLDHGDSSPRSLQLTTASDYGYSWQKESSLSMLKFNGNHGENFTGCRVGGMEIGNENVLVCGTSQPHKHKIKKISGFGYDMNYNVFFALANRKTKKVKFKWLTTYHPKKSSVTVGETRMVKLSDTRFAILFTTTQKKKTTLHYMVYSDTGKKIYSKKYSNMKFDGSSQPILSNGSIVWMVLTADWNKTDTTLYSIPAVF